MNIHKTPANDGSLVRQLCRTWEALQPLIARSVAMEGLEDRVLAGMGQVLFELYREDGQMIRDLAAAGHISHVAALQLVRRIEAAGLVKRRDCPEDGRATRVWLTSRGRSIESRMKAVSQRNHAALVEILGKNDVELLNALLGHLLDGLDARNEAERNATSAKGKTPAKRKSAK